MMSDKNAEYKERFQRWQKRTNRYITTVNSSILALSIGALGFFINSIKQREGFSNNFELAFGIVSILGLLVSCYYGISVMINRLDDFRGTVSINKKRMEGGNDWDLRQDRNENRLLGKKTHAYMDRQIVFFAISVLVIVIIEGVHMFNL